MRKILLYGFVFLLITVSLMHAQHTSPTPGSHTAPIAQDTLAALVARENTTCVVTTQGKQYCWGDTFEQAPGEIFHLTDTTGNFIPLRSVVPRGQSFLRSFCAISIGDTLLCTPAARASSSLTECRTGHCLAPLTKRNGFPAPPIRAVALDIDHACLTDSYGTAYCWGDNSFGQLGNGTRTQPPPGKMGPESRIPTPVRGGHRFAHLSANYMYTCGVTAPRGEIFCWGYGPSGQTGDSAAMPNCPETNRQCGATPTQVHSESFTGNDAFSQDVRFVTVHTGQNLACAVSTLGEVYCWGSNSRCALGQCRTPDSPLARYIPISGYVVEVGVGFGFACARTRDRRLFCWGNNNAGQLGSSVTANADEDGLPPDYRDTTPLPPFTARYPGDPCNEGGRCSPAAVEVSPGRKWSALAVGNQHACALDGDDGSVYCWGGDSTVLGRNPRLTYCENRSLTWKDERCQPTPHQVAGLPLFAVSLQQTNAHIRWQQISKDLYELRLQPKVTVNQKEMRVVIPVGDTMPLFQEPYPDGTNATAPYAWSILIPGVFIGYSVHMNLPARSEKTKSFTTFAQFVANGTQLLCWKTGGWEGDCSKSLFEVSTRSDTIIMILRDSTHIAAMFGRRPKLLTVHGRDGESVYPNLWDSTAVIYTDPQIPEPDAALVAASDRERQYLEEQRISVYRKFSQHQGSVDYLLQLGDSLSLYVKDLICHTDVCNDQLYAVQDSGWSIDDSTIVQLQARSPDSSAPQTILSTRSSAMLRANRLGTTTVRVHGLHSPADTIRRRKDQVIPRSLAREIRVIPRISRIEIVPRPDVARVKEPLLVGVRVYDQRGTVLPKIPVNVLVQQGKWGQVHSVSDTTRVTFDNPGKRLIIASVFGRADTIQVTVIEERRAK